MLDAGRTGCTRGALSLHHFAGLKTQKFPWVHLTGPAHPDQKREGEISCKGMDDGQILLESIPAVDRYFYTWSDTLDKLRSEII